MKRRTVVASLAAVGAAGVVGWSLRTGRPPLEDLEVSIAEVRAPTVEAGHATVPVVLELHNPANRAVPSPIGSFDVSVNEAETVSAEATFPTVGSGETVTETVEVRFDILTAGATLLAALRTGQFTVHLTGELESDGASRTVDERFEHGG